MSGSAGLIKMAMEVKESGVTYSRASETIALVKEARVMTAIMIAKKIKEEG